MPDYTAHYSVLDKHTVAQILLKYLHLEGVDTLFGVPGAPLMHLLVELRKQRFKFIVCRHESGAAYMADGYARVTGKLGVVLATSGPGATNALTGTMNAHNSHSGVLAITGEVPESYFGKGYLQEGSNADLHVDAIYSNAVRYSAMISSAQNFQTLLTQALREALSLPRRAAHLSLPDDVAASTLDSLKFPTSPKNYRALPPQGVNWDQVEQAFQCLLKAKWPLLLLGNGCRRVLKGKRLERFTKFVEKFGVPVMTTGNGKAVFPESHPLSLRNYGLANCKWPQYYMLLHSVERRPPKYDALLVLGSSLGEMATNKWDPLLIPDGPFIQVDVDQSVIARAFPVTLGIVAEIGAVIDLLCKLGQKTSPNKHVVQARWNLVTRIKKRSPYAEPAKRCSDITPILPQALMRCLNEALPKGAHVFVDAGNCVGWALHYLALDPPTQFHIALSMAPMGFGAGAVVGAKLGDPDRTCVSIVGDGAFLMHGTEVSTAAQYDVGAIWVVLKDDNLLMVSQGMQAFFPDMSWKDYYYIGRTNLVRFAEAMGARAFNVYSPKDMQRVLPQAIHNANNHKQPQVIVAHINTDAVPPYFYFQAR